MPTSPRREMTSRLATFVISLPDRPDRRARAAHSMAVAALEFRFVDGVTPADVDAQLMHAVRPERHSHRIGRCLLDTEIFCTLAHRRALRTFLASGAAHGLICEDDAVPRPNARRVIAEMLELFPAFDVYKLGSPPLARLKGVDAGRVRNHAVVRVYSTSVCSHAYVVSREGAQRLDAHLLPITAPYDVYLRDMYRNGCNICELMPPLVRLAPEARDSSIAEQADRTAHGRAIAWPGPRHVAFRIRHYLSRILWRWRRFGVSHVIWRREVVRGTPPRRTRS